MPDAIHLEPPGRYNESLIRDVHPSDWQNPEPAPRYNLVVIGAGAAGLVVAAGAAGLGAKVARIEKRLLGGDCLNVGCVPSKCLIRSSRAYADIRDAGQFGIGVPGGVDVDLAAAMERMRRLRSSISPHDSAERLRGLGVDVFFGTGQFTGADTVDVDGTTLRFAKAVIATGARAVRPQIPGLEDAGFLTNETVFSLTSRPKRLAVLGGGPLGCELAQALHRLGSHVTILVRSSHLLSREDPDAARIIVDAFENDGIDVRLNTQMTNVARTDDGKQITLDANGREESLVVDEILVGAGRQPNVEGLGLDAVGVEYDERHGVVVNDHLRTTNKRIYAAGDICLKHKFTHVADAAARIVIQNALFWERKRFSALTIPWCTYTDPEIAHVGLYEKDAEERRIGVTTFTRSMSDVDRAIADGEEGGLVKIHVKKGTDKIVGATIVARHAGEMISEITLAMVGGVGLGSIGGVIHPYPTQAEAIKQAADAYGRTRLTPFVAKLFAAVLKWRR